jgi:rod shape-determining protein MreC
MNLPSKRWPFFLFLLVFSLAILLFDKFGFLNFIKGGLEKIYIPFGNNLYQPSANPKPDLESQQKIIKLESEIINLKKENSDLRRLLGAPLPSKWHFLPAQIIGNDNGILLIDKGQRDGVNVNQAVIFNDFMVGKIIETGENISRLQTPNNSNFKLAVIVKSQNNENLSARGLLLVKGGRLILDQVLIEEKIVVGDIVMSALDRNIPADIPIGTITNISQPSAVFQKAEVEPMVISSQLKNVFLIIYK